MVNVVIAGIPKLVTFVKFVHFLKKAILRCKKEFHVNSYTPEANGFNQMSFSTTLKKAQKVKKTLDGFMYIHARKQYPLACWLENLNEPEIEPASLQEHNFPCRNQRPNPRPFERQNDFIETREEYYEPAPKNPRYSRSPVRHRSRSRSCGPDSSQLNAIELQIELIRKQRILMEEETKLLLEKRKLEFLQHLGPNDYGKLLKFEEVYKRGDPQEISQFLEAGPVNRAPIVVKQRKLPSYVGPCKVIVAQMKNLIASYKEVNSSNRSLFYSLLRTALKKRLTVVLQDQGYLRTQDIVSVYRARHPGNTDVKLVTDLINTIKTSCWPEKPLKKETVDVAVKIEGPPAQGQALQADTKVELADDNDDTENCFDDNDLVDLDEFEDMQDAVENWAEDEDVCVGAGGLSFENEDSTKANDVTEPNTVAENDNAQEKPAAAVAGE